MWATKLIRSPFIMLARCFKKLSIYLSINVMFYFVSNSLSFPHQRGFIILGEFLDKLNTGTDAVVHKLLGYIDDCKKNWAIIGEVTEKDDILEHSVYSKKQE